MLRLTAKSTQFGRRTFTSWLIESAGTLPIKRRKDFGDQEVDNSMIMADLINVRITTLHGSSTQQAIHTDGLVVFGSR